MTTDELTKFLENEILSGNLNPGDRLDEQALASRNNVSRTPVREALRRLSGTGLVELIPHRGAAVAKLTITEMLEMFEVMATLEGLCARLAARRMSPQERTELHERHDALLAFVENGDTDKYYDANELFHEAIYAGSHNKFLERNTFSIRNRLAPYRRFQLRQAGRLKESSLEHEKIAAAIVDGNGDLANQLMHAHVSVQGDLFTDFIATLPKSRIKAMTNL